MNTKELMLLALERALDKAIALQSTCGVGIVGAQVKRCKPAKGHAECAYATVDVRLRLFGDAHGEEAIVDGTGKRAYVQPPSINLPELFAK